MTTEPRSQHSAGPDAAAARRHVEQRLAAQPELADVDRDLWVALILEHLQPLPANRPWRIRHWIPIRAAAAATLLQRAWDDLPGIADPVADLTERQRLHSARRAWLHLADVGLAADRPEDLVTAVLRASPDTAA